jgi:hypothetical protein
MDIGGNMAFGTSSTAVNVHSHYQGTGAADLMGYDYTGRMRMSHADAGVGVTALSQFDGAAAYYRLRRYSGRNFHLSPFGTTITSGTTDTGVFPAPNVWYRFRLRVEDTGSQTEIRARVWVDGTAEPGTWQAEAVDDSATRLNAGTVGVWTMAAGTKAFDDLSVQLLTAPRTDITITLVPALNGSIVLTPDQANYSTGDMVSVEAIPDPGYVFIGWTDDLSGATNPETVSLFDDVTVGATFVAITLQTLTVDTVGNGGVAVDPPGPDHPLGSVVTLTANPNPGSFFVGWSGDLSGATNPASLTITGDLAVTATFVNAFQLDNFDSLSPGDNPAGWGDTAANNSLTIDDTLFSVIDVGGNLAFGTGSAQANIHSHFTGAGASTLDRYVYTGRMRMTHANGGIGVTFFSGFTGDASYYRLRRYAGRDFHLAPLGSQVPSGTTATGVTPAANLWYRFEIEVEDQGTQTAIRAKVWEEGSSEPLTWQIDAVDDSGSRRSQGSFGIWSFSAGSKYWDDLKVELLP